jgi:hypothetical protein
MILVASMKGMSLWFSAALASSVVASMLAPGCGTADSSSTSTPPPEDRCEPIYYGGGVVPPPPDGASLCAPGACNYQTQEGCTQDQTCYLKIDQAAATVIPACRPAGKLPKGSPCDAKATALAERCERGLFCSTTGCRKLCCGADWSACDPGESCIRTLVVELPDASVPANADLCLPVNDCDPLDPSACKEQGRVCRIADPVGNVACMPASNLVAGDPCDAAHQCGSGLSCTRSSPTAQGICHHLCAFGPCVPDTCGDEGTCVHFGRNPDGIGECVAGWTGPGVVVDGGAPPSDASVR